MTGRQDDHEDPPGRPSAKDEQRGEESANRTGKDRAERPDRNGGEPEDLFDNVPL